MKQKIIRLNELSKNDIATVVGINCDNLFKRRLMDMGIIPGTNVVLKGKAPMGDPIEIKVRGYSLTLRNNEASSILVETR